MDTAVNTDANIVPMKPTKKITVNYYDIETDQTVEKNCLDIIYDQSDNQFSFTPVDDPPRIYKAVVIDRPVVQIYQNDRNVRIIVEGYQYMKSGGYYKTKTTINICYNYED